MAVHKITLGRTIDGIVEYIYPRSIAELIEYTDTQNVRDKLDELDETTSDLYDITVNLQDALDKAQESADAAQSAADAAMDAAEKAQDAADNISYKAGTGLDLDTDTNTFNHLSSITADTIRGSGTGTLAYGSSFKIPSITYNSTGHITATAQTTLTLPGISDSINSTSSNTAASSAAVNNVYNIAIAAQEAAESAQNAADANVYTAGTGISISSSNAINHSNSITAGTASGSATGSLSYGGTFNMPTVSYDAQGHITGSSTTTMTMPSVSDSTSSTSSSTAASSAAVKAAMDAAEAAQAAAEGISYSAGTGLSLSGTTFNHSNSVTAGTVSGDSSKTLSYGGTFKVPSITYDAQGHITSTTTTTMTMPAEVTSVSTAEKLGTSTVGSGTKPIYLSSGTATASSSTVGSSSTPVYLNSGTITACSSITASSADTATTAEKLGTSTVGSGTKPIYLSSGTATASTSTVGSSSTPVYLNAGTITACTDIETSSNTCYYGTCSTSASIPAKSATIDGFSLITGVTVIIKFTYGNTTGSPTLNISSTGNIDIYTYDTTLSGLRSFPDNSIVQFVYDGTCWLIISMIDGYNCIASGAASHAEGYATTASGNYSHAEGYDTTVSGAGSHAEGNNTTVSGSYSHAEGYDTIASGSYSHTEGVGTIASNVESHAEGYDTTASEQASHAEGIGTTASGTASHAEGYNTTASGTASHAEGFATIASESNSHAEGYDTTANNFGMHAGGKFNKLSSSTMSSFASNIGDVFVLGNGTSNSSLSNAFRVTYAGAVYGLSSFNSSGADYAEFIKPWADGNPDEEDRVGYFVTVKDGMLYKASSGDYIAGITSGNPSIVGNSDEDYYHKYERDEFNRIIWEDVVITKNDKDESTEELEINTTVTSTIQKDDENDIEEPNMQIELSAGKPMSCCTDYGDTDSITCSVMKISEDYDNTLQDTYIERKDRPEWDYVGMIGVLPVRDDGTCEAGGFAKCGDDGIATSADSWTIGTYYVIERITDSVVNVIFK